VLVERVRDGRVAEPRDEAGRRVDTLADVPTAARDTISKEAAGGTITKVESETENGKPIYEAHVKPAQGKAFSIKVDATGKLLGREHETEDKK
jgi:uncharacterized membrane protein YkoI